MTDLKKFARNILDRLEDIVIEAETTGKPLEVDPFRGQIFELFVQCEAANCVHDEADPDLSSDGICQTLAERWGLREAAQESIRSQEKMSTDAVGRMRLLWSILRMWMEWTYAWQRWPEFKQPQAEAPVE
ncbi:MAG: hypothetical protein KDA69_04390 [Planctomycetaceae bacterium]|nr:hypothetical protein [Planctomycetaceae bacterium]MCA9031165.1 hypothetical protein [Planctomycetaceae bacterium]MCA9043534.1 hypothetical protein [Planctomycetaceae bacterium]MCB9952461.1 hypothetical protein [Planctomycetaceae bacterium]